MYSQFEEEQVIQDFFGDFVGSLIDIGANDGKTFSNSLRCIEKGWGGILVEPTHQAFERLVELHKGRCNVVCRSVAVTDKDGEATMFVNGSHYGTGDVGLLSRVERDFVDGGITVPKDDAYKWKDLQYVQTVTFETLLAQSQRRFELILIDAEGQDWKILQQINLRELSTRMVVIEFDGVHPEIMTEYCAGFGMRLKHKTVTNLIFALG